MVLILRLLKEAPASTARPAWQDHIPRSGNRLPENKVTVEVETSTLPGLKTFRNTGLEGKCNVINEVQ